VNFISSDICGLYSVGAVIIIVTSCICGYFANERDMLSLKNYHTSHYYLTFESSQLMEESSPFGEETRNQGQEDIGERFGMRQIMQILRDAPFPFWKLFLIQCFTWFAWFTEFVFITSWMGSEVLQGNPNAPEGSKSRLSFDYGVRMGNVGLSLQSVVAIAYSLVLPRLVKVAGIKFCYILAHFLLVSRWMEYIYIYMCIYLETCVNDEKGVLSLLDANINQVTFRGMVDCCYCLVRNTLGFDDYYSLGYPISQFESARTRKDGNVFYSIQCQSMFSRNFGFYCCREIVGSFKSTNDDIGYGRCDGMVRFLVDIYVVISAIAILFFHIQK